MTDDGLRSRTMRAVRSKDTKPELLVRKLLHSLGFRYRLHRNDLPGSPDIVFPSRKKVIFVHGCFWHGHACPRGNRKPKANADYWAGKVERNRARDRRSLDLLHQAGWSTLIVWECDLKDRESLVSTLRAFLGG